MLFQKRFDRARSLQRRMRGLTEEEDAVRENEEFLPEKPEIKEELEKGDMFAMITAAFLTVFLPAVGVLLLVAGLSYLLFFH